MLTFLGAIKNSGVWKPIVLASAIMIVLAIFFGLMMDNQYKGNLISKQKVTIAANEAYVKQLQNDIIAIKEQEKKIQVIHQKGDVITRTIERIVIKRDLTDEEKDVVAVITSRIDRVQHTDSSDNSPKNVSGSGTPTNR